MEDLLVKMTWMNRYAYLFVFVSNIREIHILIVSLKLETYTHFLLLLDSILYIICSIYFYYTHNNNSGKDNKRY